MKIFSTCIALMAGIHAWAQSGPMTLDEALAFSRTHSPAIKAARAEFLAALAAERTALAMAGPQLSANGFASTGNNAAILNAPAQADATVSMSMPRGSFTDGNLMLMVPIIAEDVRAMASSARWQSRAAAGEFKEVEADVKLSVQLTYYAALALREQVASALAAREAVAELLKATNARYEAGKTIEASVQRVQAELGRAERDLLSAKNAHAKAVLDLLQVIGGRMDAEIEISEAANPLSDVPSLPELMQIAMDSRGALVAAQARTKASDADLRAAIAQGRPKLYATGMADATNRRDMGGLTLGFSVSIPLFDGGRIRSEIDRARSMRARAEAELESIRIQIEKEVRQALLDYGTAKANLDSANTSAVAAASAYEILTLRVEAGKAILLEQLDALQSLTEARTELAKARLELLASQARLWRATGGSR